MPEYNFDGSNPRVIEFESDGEERYMVDEIVFFNFKEAMAFSDFILNDGDVLGLHTRSLFIAKEICSKYGCTYFYCPQNDMYTFSWRKSWESQ